MTYMRGKTQYEEGRFHHVVCTYDGKTMALYVDGKLSPTQDVHQPPSA